jgi:hypothetical protein
MVSKMYSERSRTKILTILAVITLLGVCPVRADLVFDIGRNTYDDSYGYNVEVWVNNDAILDVLGGEIGKLETTDFATANLYGGDINWLVSDESSVVNIYCGDIHQWLAAFDDSSVYLYAYDVVYHPAGEGGRIEGTYFRNDTSFSFFLLPYTGTYSHIYIVPEPASLLLLGFGAFALRRRG